MSVYTVAFLKMIQSKIVYLFVAKQTNIIIIIIMIRVVLLLDFKSFCVFIYFILRVTYISYKNTFFLQSY